MGTLRFAQLDCRCLLTRKKSLGSVARLAVGPICCRPEVMRSDFSDLDEHEWMLATPDEPWKSLYCDELPSMQFKLPANSHLDWFGNLPINEPSFQAEWLYDR